MPLAALATAHGRTALCAALCADGAIILSMPAAARSAQRVAACYAACDAFFALPAADKLRHGATEGPGCQVGYMAQPEHGMEMFEAKLRHDPRWPWPAAIRAAVEDARELLHGVALGCLRALAEPLGLDAAALTALLDGPAASTDFAARPHGCSNTAMRVWRYAAGGEPNAMHCDTTLLTVSPAGTVPGLRLRRPDGSSLAVEEGSGLGAGQLLLFAGDSLSLLSGGRVPALMHEVVSGAAPRLSMPFFLRPRQDALLAPPAGGGAAVRMLDLESNAADVRRSWWWKRAPYYQGANVTPLEHSIKHGGPPAA